MIYKIKDPKQINFKTVATNTIKNFKDDAIGNKILKGIAQRDTITSNTVFTTYMKNYGFQGYSLLENKDMIIVTKESNIVREKELKDIYASLGIRSLIKSGDVTILVPNCGKKIIVRRDKEDQDDNLKAVMILMLKEAGYNIDDIYTVANSLPTLQAEQKVEKVEKKECIKTPFKPKPSKVETKTKE